MSGAQSEDLKLLPCPFCGSTDAPELFTARQISQHDCDAICECSCHDCEELNFAVCCAVESSGCGAAGGFEIRKDRAAERWNRRSAQ